MSATPFGKMLRKLRIDKGVLLKDQADALNVSSAYLSAVELGKKNVAPELVKQCADYFELNEMEYRKLQKLAADSPALVKIGLDGAQNEDRRLVAAFARSYQQLPDGKKEELFRWLDGISDS